MDSAGAGSLGKVVNSQTSILLFPPLPSGSVPSGVGEEGEVGKKKYSLEISVDNSS